MIRENLHHKAMKCGLAIAAAVCLVSVAPNARAESYKVPDAAEISTYPPEAIPFYTAGIQALDHVDYLNAYDNLAKAAQLQPNAIRLNLLVAALARRKGLNEPASEAKNYYDTAIASYNNILAQKSIDDELRRDVTNQLKVTEDNKNNLAQRDARREAVGGQFVAQYNKELAPQQRKGSAKAAANAAAAAAAPPPTPVPGGYADMTGQGAGALETPGMQPGMPMPNANMAGPGGPATAGNF